MDFSFTYLMHPLVGSVIGYITNWIAVKMLFKPSKAVYIGKFKLPFTPGIIPKNQTRLAHGISSTISNSLLNEDILKESLLSEEILKQLKEYINTYLNSDSESSITINDYFTNSSSSEKYLEIINNLTDNVSISILNTIKDANLANILSTQIETVMDESMKKGLISRLARKPVMENITANLEPEINKYIDENGEDLIRGMVQKELSKYLNTSSDMVKDFIKDSNIDIEGIILSIYTSIISTKLTSILNTINISNIIENRINSMDPKEIERLVLSIISKELNALVNLGAFIGFILGLVNIFI